jgi:thiol-disulfide isomerase/thioredoxin
MKNKFILILLCLFPLIIKAQGPAPDFTITDSNGNQHSLYADYLDNGKVVLIELFFTTCPPCNTIAPYVQDLYETWGEGSGDVEFIELSIMSWDNNSNVLTNQINHGLTFIGAGADGGSNEASEVYKNGTYGPYYGTPTFVVIAPDGTVNYGISGISIPATIDSLDQAISDAMNMMAPSVDVDIVAQDYDGIFVQGATVFIESIEDDISINLGMTDNAGSFSFTYPSDSAPTMINPRVRLALDGNDDLNVTTLDLVRIQQFILNLYDLDPFQQLAADVNQSGALTASDLLTIRKLILHIYSEFPNTDSWLFYDQDCDPGGDVFNSNCVNFINIDTDLANQSMQFKALKMGDVVD